MPPVLYLIDGHALAYRMYFALTGAGSRRWQNSKGEPTAGSFGFASTLLRILEQENPEYLAVAFDTGKTFRNDMFPDYKATRAKMPDDLRPQIERIRQMVDLFGFPRLEKEGFEADDVIGTIAREAKQQGFGVKIFTGDRDLLQLVDERIFVVLPGKEIGEAKVHKPEDVRDVFGVSPEQVVEYKGLVGDKSDNIPGVMGVGEKTAVNLLTRYANLEEIFAHLDELPSSTRTKLEAGRESAFLSRELATIDTHVPILLDLNQTHVDLKNTAELEAVFQELEFKSLLPRLRSLRKSPEVEIPRQQLSLFGAEVTHVGLKESAERVVHVVNTSDGLMRLAEKLTERQSISLDTETTSTQPLLSDLTGISIAVEKGEAYYIPVGHTTGEAQLPLHEIQRVLQPLLADAKRKICGHNIKFDAMVLARFGLPVACFGFDTMIAGWLVDPASRRLGLKDMAEDLLQVDMQHIEELIGKGANQKNMSEIPIDKVAAYAGADAEVIWRLMPVLEEKLAREGASDLFTNLEMPLIPVLIQMEQNGIALDVSFLKEMSFELDTRMQEIQEKVFEILGYSLNLNSTQQLSKALFETLGLRPPDVKKKTASGHFSTSANVLEQMQGEHPVIDLILEFRELAKLKSTYVDTLPLQINPLTGRVHTSFNQTGSVTGRLASSDPNLQNIPTRTELGRKVRKAFVAAPGKVLLAVDYSQIELRIVAHMSGDDAMLKAFREGQDIHTATAAAIYGKKLSEVTKEERRNAKAINFGLIYGMSAFGLKNVTDLTLAEAENFREAYFRQFPGVKKYLDEIRKEAARNGFVKTLFGRRRYFPNLKQTANFNLRSREEREAINAPIQGTAADIIKLAMKQLPQELNKAGVHSKMLLQVHDELIFECDPGELTETTTIVRHVMENVAELSIPLLTESRTGHNWGELEPVG